MTTCAVVIFRVKGSCITSVDGILLALILALATCMWTITLWLRYIDDTFTAVHKDGIDDFHEHLNRQNVDIQFTKEIEENSKIPFLDCLDNCDNNRLRTTIHRKPTHTDRLLDQSSYNPTSHKATTIRSLTRQAQLVCDSPNNLQDETNYLNNIFSKNNYNMNFARRNTHSNTDFHTKTNVNSGPVTRAVIPYITGTSETIAHILQPYNIRVAHKPITTGEADPGIFYCGIRSSLVAKCDERFI